MAQTVWKGCLLICIGFLLASCTPHFPPVVNSELYQGKRDFDAGYYKRAMHELLPMACDGNPEAQYAIGYLFYYGLGVVQDTEVGYFWIKRSADKGYLPAIRGLKLIAIEKHISPWQRVKFN